MTQYERSALGTRPPSHAVHCDEPRSDTSLSSHSPAHSMAPAWLYLPGSHVKQLLFSGWLACVPALHCSHCDFPGSATQPALQSMQID